MDGLGLDDCLGLTVHWALTRLSTGLSARRSTTGLSCTDWIFDDTKFVVRIVEVFSMDNWAVWAVELFHTVPAVISLYAMSAVQYTPLVVARWWAISSAVPRLSNQFQDCFAQPR